MEFSKNFERDWEFYYNNRKIFFLVPKSATDIKMAKYVYDEKGKSAKECFYIFDSTGKCAPCNEIDLLREVFNCKGALNLQIKQWAEGRAEMLAWAKDAEVELSDRWGYNMMAFRELSEIKLEYNAPDWVIEAIKNQSLKITKTPDYC